MQDRLDWVVVVGADTIVELDGQILEKPGTAEKAKHMLQRSAPFTWRSLGGHLSFHFTGSLFGTPLTNLLLVASLLPLA